MQQTTINSDNRKFCLYITIKCKGKKTFRCAAGDNKPFSKYADRTINVDGERTIYFSFPISPLALRLIVCNVADKNDKDFEVYIEERPLKDYAVWLDDKTVDFLKLGLYFSQVCGFEAADAKGRKFATSNDEFKIRYYPVIRDVQSGRPMSTPARIGHNSGIIDVSKAKFDKMTVAMRVCILLHEYSHKYRNPEMDLPIKDEVGADINGLYIYLGLGFSKVDAIYVYANVFLKAQTPGNIDRMRKIMEYIKRFENQEIASLN